MSLQTALPIVDHAPTYKSIVIQELSRFRREWETVAEGQSLLEVPVSLGLLLADIADRMSMTQQERFVLLGKSLMQEIEEFMAQQVSLVEE